MAIRRPLDVERELLDAFEHSAKVTEYLVRVLPARLWHLPPPGGRGRTIAAIVAHMQSLRRTFAKAGGAGPLPALERKSVTPAEARRALGQSTAALTTIFRAAIDRGDGRIKGLPRRVVNLMIYLVQHDAHHRGQITSLARELGHEFSRDDVMRLWGWKKLP
jgi:uncharacterized damage-inducible protein DinB